VQRDFAALVLLLKAREVTPPAAGRLRYVFPQVLPSV